MANVTTQPTHRIHSDSEPLPVSGGEGPDYSADNMNRLADQDQDMYPRNTTTTTHHNTHSPSHIPTRTSVGTNDANRDSDRGPQQGSEYPKEAHLGESRFDERSGLNGDEAAFDATPHAKPGIKDKIIGKTEEVKYFHEFLPIYVLLKPLLACGKDSTRPRVGSQRCYTP